MTYFISDTHFGETEARHKLFYRNRSFKTPEEFDKTLINNWNNIIKSTDDVYIIGDFAYSKEGLENAKLLNGKKILIKGNYDDQFSNELLNEYFDEVHDDFLIFVDDKISLFLNHYPIKGKSEILNIVGHIHSLWKVQRNMINVSVECWDYKPVSMNDILFVKNAMGKIFDQNVFAGELECNITKAQKDKEVFLSGENIDSDLMPIFLWRCGSSEHWAKSFTYGLNKMKRDFIVIDTNRGVTNKIKEDLKWLNKTSNLTLDRNGLFVLWFDSSDKFDYRLLFPSSDVGNEIPDDNIVMGIKECSPDLEKKLNDKGVKIYPSFDAMYKRIEEFIKLNTKTCYQLN